MPDILLSINIICSGRPETKRCLTSLAPLIDSVSCELIITDTGCDAFTRTLIEQYADLVIDFDWCDDFSAARNAGLQASKGQWYMYLDDDEYFELDIESLIDFFNNDEYLKYNCASYFQRNYRDIEGACYADIAVLRLAKRTPQLRFNGLIHEYLMIENKSHKLIESHVEHFGYVSTSEAAANRTARNIPLLLKMMEIEPDNMRWSAHLAQELRAAGDMKALYDLCNMMLYQTKGRQDADTALARDTFYAGRSIGAAVLLEAQEKITLIEEALTDTRINGVTRAFMLSYLCELYYKLGQTVDSKKAGQEYMRLYESYKGDRCRLAQETVIFTDVAFDEAHLKYIGEYIK